MALIAGLLPGAWSPAWAGVVAGHVVFSRGACAALVEGADNAPRLLGSAAEIYEGDLIQTGNDSFVVVEFADKARITIRPNSSFRVQKYATQGAQEAQLVLEKGGISADVGQIAKSNPEKFQVDTPVASIKSQGAGFNARICDKDCDGKAAAEPAKPDNSVARVAQAQGKVEAIGVNGAARDLATGNPLYEKERVRSQGDAYAVLVFRDGSKTTVQPGSELEITAFRYQPGDNANNTQALRLIAGGIRALTGAIGKEKKENVQLVTPVATIGIRGTVFYHHHLPAPLNGSPPGGYTHVNHGGVWQQTGAGTYDLGEGKTGYIAGPNSPQNTLPGEPPFMLRFEQMTPSPENVQVDPALMFNSAPKPGPSLTVQAKGDGKVVVEDKKGGKTELGDKQSSKTNSEGGTAMSNTGDAGDGDGGEDGFQSLPGGGGDPNGGSGSAACS
ncbi:FecR family protein [Methylogaea oryzae]|uniref:FecR family protein n=1 Tax=Methylogaea oryzae TaxID=1295382 RepID=UPI00138EDEA9|nr:FecR domain-containing protein [Methylogaea oryzae]